MSLINNDGTINNQPIHEDNVKIYAKRNQQKTDVPTFTNHHELRRDIGIDCSEPVLTDQSYKNACDINIIMAQYAKTGVFPTAIDIPASYIDNTTIPSLETAFDIANRAYDAFLSLPPEVRRVMDNDPAQLENFVSNEENRPLLEKHGIIITKAEPKLSTTEQYLKNISEKLDTSSTGGATHGKNT